MKKSLFSAAVLFLSVICFAQNAHAAFSLSVSPRRGGQNIHFEEAQGAGYVRNEEVTVEVTSTVAVPYRIYYEAYQPLTNETGQTIPQGSFVMFSPSTPVGTLKVQQETPIAMGQQPVYFSNERGDSDSFVLVFNVNVPDGQAGGFYRTQINFIAEPVNPSSAASPSRETLNVQLDLKKGFEVHVTNATGGHELDLGAVNEKKSSAAGSLKIETTGQAGSAYRVFQQLTQPLTSSDGETLDEETLTFTAQSAQGGQVNSGGTLTNAPQLVYTSDNQGSGNAVEIQYLFTPAAAQKYGTYSGVISFKFDGAGVPAELISVPVKVTINPIFYLDVDTQDVVGIHFGTLKSGQGDVTRRVHIKVKTNRHEAYQVSQILSRMPTLSDGSTLPASGFTYFGADAQGGTVSSLSPVPMRVGESPVFTSDKDGNSSDFVINYSLAPSADAKAGSYNAEVNYSLTSL